MCVSQASMQWDIISPDPAKSRWLKLVLQFSNRHAVLSSLLYRTCRFDKTSIYRSSENNPHILANFIYGLQNEYRKLMIKWSSSCMGCAYLFCNIPLFYFPEGFKRRPLETPFEQHFVNITTLFEHIFNTLCVHLCYICEELHTLYTF